MTQYTSAEMLEDGRGRLIPQYLDVADKTASPQGTFKPLDEVMETQLTGSIEEVHVKEGIAISPGDYSVQHDSLVQKDYRYVVLGVEADTAHQYRYQIAWQISNNYILKDAGDITSGEKRDLSDWLPVRGSSWLLYLINKDTVDHTYSLYVLGVR